MKANEIWRSYGTDYKNMTKRLLAQAGLADLIRRKTSGRPAASVRIGIKPNLVTPAPASFGGTTPHIIATGGMSRCIAQHCQHPITIDPHLLFKGLFQAK